jgi:hypothetical protein
MKRHRIKRAVNDEYFPQDSDDRFAFIAGYTEGGFPYGTTWEELQGNGLVDDVIVRQEDDSLF